MDFMGVSDLVDEGLAQALNYWESLVSDIPDTDPNQGRVELGAPGYRRAAVSFRLDASQPAFVKHIVLEREVPAAISVQAHPWGLVDIPGVVAGRETPVTNVRLRAGSYAVRVRHPPSGRVATTRVVLAGGVSRRCLATFGNAASISCR